jgi:TolA-binding protein
MATQSRPVHWHQLVLLCLLAMSTTALLSAGAFGQEKEEEEKSDPKAVAIYGDAANFQNKKLYDIAIEEWQRLLKTFPADPLAKKGQFYLGICHLQQKQYSEAAASFDLAVTKYKPFDSTEEAYYQLGWCRFTVAGQKKGDDQEALLADSITAFTEGITKYAKGPFADNALFFRGEAHYKLGNRDEAIASYQQLVDNYAKSDMRSNGLYALGVSYEELKKDEDAARIFEIFLEQFPEDNLAAEIQLRTADIILRGGSVEEAEKLFAAMVAKAGFPQLDYALYRQAGCLATLKRHEDAAAIYNELVDSHGDSSYAADARLSVGRCYFNARKHTPALEWFQKVIALKGVEMAEAAHWASRIQLEARQFDAVLELTSAALPLAAENPFLPQLLVDRGDALLEKGDKQEALTQYLQVVDKHGDHSIAPQALYNATFTLLDLKQQDSAVARATTFLEKYKESSLLPDIRYLLGEAQVQQDKIPEAEVTFRQLLEKHAGHTQYSQWQLRLAEVLYLQKKYEQTVSYTGGILEKLKDPQNQGQAHFLVGSAHFFQDQFAEAATSLAASLKASPRGGQADEALLYLARSQFKQKQLGESRATLERLLAEFPKGRFQGQAFYRLGECYDAEKKSVEAIKQYDLLLEASPESPFVPYAMYNKGYDLLTLEKVTDAAAIFADLVKRFPEHDIAGAAMTAQAETGYRQGRNQLDDKKYDDAIVSLQGLLKDYPDFPRLDAVLYDLGWAYLGAGQQAEAIQVFERITKEYKKSSFVADAYYRIGEDQYQDDRFSEALASYALALESTPEVEIREAILHKTGWAHFKADDFAKALESFQVQVDEFDEGVFVSDGRFMLAECQFKLGKWDEALALYKPLIEVKLSGDQFPVLVLLHGGQSARQLKQWDESLALVNQVISNHKDSIYLPQAQLTAGRAHYGKKEYDPADELFEMVATGSRNATGAEARFRMGAVRFVQKKHAEAIRQYQRVMYGFGAQKALDEVKKFQHLSATEAAICSEVLAGVAKTAAEKEKFLEDAKEFYQYILDHHAQSGSAPNAKNRLGELNKG